MKMLVFAKRCAKEIVRDPLNLLFGLGFPVVLLFLMSAIQANVPVAMFQIESLAPGITVFGLSFMALFSATLLAKDRESAFLQRLYTTPLRPSDFVLGYLLPILPIGLAQSLVCYLLALPLGLPLSVNLIYAMLLNLPATLFYISLGLLCGSIFTVKQVGGICGALLTNLSAWLAGIWFDPQLIGGAFGKIANLLPFIHAVELEKAAVIGDFSQVLSHLCPVLIYAVLVTVVAILLFLRQMKRQ